MPPLPQTNVTLTQISGGGGFTPDYDRSGTDAPAKWTGRVGAYLREQLLTRLGTDTSGTSRVKQTTLYVPGDLRGVEIQTGDQVTFVTRDGQSDTRTVDNISGAMPPVGIATPALKLALREEAGVG